MKRLTVLLFVFSGYGCGIQKVTQPIDKQFISIIKRIELEMPNAPDSLIMINQEYLNSLRQVKSDKDSLKVITRKWENKLRKYLVQTDVMEFQ